MFNIAHLEAGSKKFLYNFFRNYFVNSFATVFKETYFDIIFAMNRLIHPGEKRMVQYAKEQAEILPADFEENLDRLFQSMFTDSEKAVQTIGKMRAELKRL